MGTLSRMLKFRRYLHSVYQKPVTSRTPFESFVLRHGSQYYDTVMSRRFGSSFPVGLSVGEGLILPHDLAGIFVNARIGRNVTILHHVTIGSHRDTFPVIGDNVYIGANATIIGRCVIGDGAKIGAGVTLVDAVIPPGAVIINKSAFNLTEGKPVYPDKAPEPTARLVS
jgi:serine O-acetyltransferase